MGQALYRKYRSKKLSEIVGQEHITTTLENALKKGAISHAYLFTGPRGVGKTSIARILAHEVNGLPYDDSVHLDIIEIDAASNRRIDEIRNLREHVHSAPTSGKYKVYIIDEVHMLTKEAFNALLKTLEEPPEHVIFILATTEAHKLPETIISRTQRFTFKPVEHTQAVEHLKQIAKSEGVSVEDDALALIAEHGQGSFRDSISLLDQVSSGRKEIKAGDVRSTLGIAPDAAIESLITALEVGSASVILQTLEDLRMSGYHTPQLAKQLARKLRLQLLDETNTLTRKRITALLKRLIDVPASHDPDTLLELILIESLPEDQSSERQEPDLEPKRPLKKSVDEPAAASEPAPVPDEPKLELLGPQPMDENDDSTTVALTPQETILDESMWQDVLNAIKKNHNTLYSVARMASPTFSDDTVTLTFAFPFHQKRLEDAKNKKTIADIVSNLMGKPIQLACVVDTGHRALPKSEAKKPPKQNLDNISNIFGSAEVLE
jgi:DNA polymerase-3 subunit gamma/tau